MVESNETWSDKHKWIDHARRKNTFFSKMFLYSWQTTNIICIFFCFSSSVSLIFASTSSASHSDLSMYSCYIVYISLCVYVLSVLVYIFKITLFENIVNECLKLVSERLKVHSMQKTPKTHKYRKWTAFCSCNTCTSALSQSSNSHEVE